MLTSGNGFFINNAYALSKSPQRKLLFNTLLRVSNLARINSKWLAYLAASQEDKSSDLHPRLDAGIYFHFRGMLAALDQISNGGPLNTGSKMVSI